MEQTLLVLQNLCYKLHLLRKAVFLSDK